FITKPIDLKDLEIAIANSIEKYIFLKKLSSAKREMLEVSKELEIAKVIQQSFIPHQFTPFAEPKPISMFGTMIPAKEIGGDFFDFFPLDSNRLGFVIGDVVGKGVPAALFMGMTRTLLRTIALRGFTTSECLKMVNKFLFLEEYYS